MVQKEQTVRLFFDGWPSVVFSGWPNVSYGTYGAKVFAIDNYANEHGQYRVLLIPDTNDHKWPEQLRMGSGAQGMALLKEVPIWYEVWRQFNGFPPDYYQTSQQESSKNEK